MAATGRERLLAQLEDLPSVGPVLAKRIYETLNPSSLQDVKSHADDESLTTVKGIGPSRCDRIARGFREHFNDGSSGRISSDPQSVRARFLEKLRCPDCPDGSLFEEDRSLRCSTCGAHYHEYRGIVDFAGAPGNGSGPNTFDKSLSDMNGYRRYFRDYIHPVIERVFSAESVEETNDLTGRYLNLRRDSELLDFGCRTGDNTCRFVRTMRAGNSESQGLVVGVDVLWSMLEQARLSAQRAGLDSWSRYARTGTNHLPFKDNSFTHVHTSEILHLIEDIQGTAQSFARVLKPGGVLVIGTQLLGNGLVRPVVKRADEMLTDVHWFTRQELYDVLSRTGFEVESELRSGDYITLRAKRI